MYSQPTCSSQKRPGMQTRLNLVRMDRDNDSASFPGMIGCAFRCRCCSPALCCTAHNTSADGMPCTTHLFFIEIELHYMCSCEVKYPFEPSQIRMMHRLYVHVLRRAAFPPSMLSWLLPRSDKKRKKCQDACRSSCPRRRCRSLQWP